MHNDMAAVGMLLTLRGLGVDVPGEMSVANRRHAHRGPRYAIALTTVSQDPRTLATESGRAVARIEGSTRTRARWSSRHGSWCGSTSTRS